MELMVYERYCSVEMSDVWSATKRYERWRRVELAVMRARCDIGQLDDEVLALAETVPAPSPDVVNALEQVTRHDVVAFLQAWTDPMPDHVATWIHRDLTSSDVVETAQALAVRETSELLDDATEHFVVALRDHALAHRTTVRLARTHGRAAEPDVWGHRVADFAFAAARCRARLARAAEDAGLAKISGPVGRYSRLERRIEQRVADELGLTPAPVATQVVLRDSLATWIGAVAVLSSVCEAIALEVRHGQREEVAELFEPNRAMQVGSSSMPHKQNPVTAEKVCGLAKVVRALVGPVTEGVALWHERDLSHSSVERIALPQAAALTEHQLTEMTRVVTGLRVDDARMAANLRSAGFAASSAAMLDNLIDQGMDRWEAHSLLQPPTGATPERYEEVILQRLRDAGLGPLSADLTSVVLDGVRRSESLVPVFDAVARLP